MTVFCENCGSRIPDGAKYCTECGVRIAAKPDWSTVSQEANAPVRSAPDAAEPAEADGSAIGYSTVAGYTRVPTDVPDAARKPLYTRWWFWLCLVIAALVLAALLFVALIVYGMRNTMPPTDAMPAELEAILSDSADLTEIDQIPDILESTFGLSDPDDAFPLDADDQYTPMDTLLDRIKQSLAGTDLEYDVWADEDDWVFVDLWTDDLDDLAEAAAGGDEASLAQWRELTGNIRAMSEDYLADLLAGGQHNAVCVVSLLDDADSGLSLAIAIDGELILDLATGLDAYGLLEE